MLRNQNAFFPLLKAEMEGECKGPSEGSKVAASVGRGEGERRRECRAFTEGTLGVLGAAPLEAVSTTEGTWWLRVCGQVCVLLNDAGYSPQVAIQWPPASQGGLKGGAVGVTPPHLLRGEEGREHPQHPSRESGSPPRRGDMGPVPGTPTSPL